MSLQEDFSAAQEQVKLLPTRPDNSTLLELYALYKQGSSGDISGKRPGMLDMKGRAKFDAWASKKGQDADSAMQSYIALVAKLS